MDRFRQDLGYGIRMMRRQPGFTLVAVLTLALGIGANAAMVSFALPILFPHLPYEDPDRLVVLKRVREGQFISSNSLISYPAFSDWQERNQICAELSLMISDERNLAGHEADPERIQSLLVSGNLLETLGIEPFLGRGFSSQDDRRGADRAAMLSYELWQRRFGGDSKIIDRTITIDELTYSVIGVLPPGLSAENIGAADLSFLWLPINLFHEERRLGDRRQSTSFTMVCRLEPGVSLAAAREEMARITQALAADYPETDRDKRALVVPLREDQVAGVRPMILALFGAVIFVLLIACANLVNLFLARFVARRQEYALRSALGAGRGRLIALGIAEVLALALTGALIGLIAAYFVVQALPPLLEDVPHADQARLSPAVLAFTILLCLAVTLVVGLIPGLRALSPSWRLLLTPSLGSRPLPMHGLLRQSLVVGEFSLALVLVTAVGLALASYLHLEGEDLGFSPQGILCFDVALPMSKYGDLNAWTAYYDQALSGIATLPGIESVSLTTSRPFGGRSRGAPIFAGDRDIPARSERAIGYHYTVNPSFFKTLKIPLIEGRTFTPRDNESSQSVVVINQSVARRLWPDRSAVGQRLGFEFLGGTIDDPVVKWREVIGVVGDANLRRPLSEPPRLAIFAPYTQRPNWWDGSSPPMALLLETDMPPASLTKLVYSELLKFDPNQPIGDVRALEEFVGDELRDSRTALVLLALFAALALALALVGIYGVVSYLVAGSTREIGVRMALGAKPARVLADLLRQSLGLILVGSVLGWIASALLANFASSLLYGIQPADPVVFLGSTLVLATAALLATLVPALRATRIDPSQALHYE